MKVSAEMSNPLEFNPSFLPNLYAHKIIRSTESIRLTRSIPDNANIPKGWKLLKTVAEGDVVGDIDGPDLTARFVHAHGTGNFLGDLECKLVPIPGKEQQLKDMVDHEFLKP